MYVTQGSSLRLVTPQVTPHLQTRLCCNPACAGVPLCLQELSPSAQRVVLSPHGLSGGAAGPDQLFTLLSSIKPGAYEELADVVPAHVTDPDQQVRPRSAAGLSFLS